MKTFNVERVIGDLLTSGMDVQISDRDDSVYVIGSLENKSLVKVLKEYVDNWALKMQYVASVDCFVIYK
jgi:hypothetical protein